MLAGGHIEQDCIREGPDKEHDQEGTCAAKLRLQNRRPRCNKRFIILNTPWYSGCSFALQGMQQQVLHLARWLR